MKTISAWSIATLLTLICTISSCGAPPTTSQLHLLGADTQRIPITEAPAGLVRLVFYSIPSHQDSPPSTAKEAQPATAEMLPLKHQCYGSYITKGAILTAKHCMDVDNETIVMIKLWFFSGHILYLKSPRHASTSTFTFTSILHPAADLALLVFDAQSLQPPPPTVQLAPPPNKEHQRPPLYTEAVVYSSAGTNKHPNYPNDTYQYSPTSHIRLARGLYVLNPYHPEWCDYLDRIDTNHIIFERFTQEHKVYTYSCNYPWWGLGFIRTYKRKSLGSIPDYGETGQALVVTAYLKGADSSLTEAMTREVLFCPGDSGSGLLDSNGKLIGVLISIPFFSVLGSHSFLAFDRKATNKIGCRHVAFAADIHEHKNWIKKTLRFYSVN